MQINGVGHISLNYTKENFLELRLRLESRDSDWRKAIQIFEDRMNERYFNVIKRLSIDPINNGFVIMAINCMLIDTFVKFFDASIDNRNNKQHYVSFLCYTMSEIFSTPQKAIKFYENIRCSILHSTQTSEGYRLANGVGKAVDFDYPSAVLVDVELFSEEVHKVYDEYVDKLIEGDIELRLEFMKRMYKLCGVSNLNAYNQR